MPRLIVGIGRDVVELIHRDEAVVERGSTPNRSTAKRKVAWVQTSTLITAFEEFASTDIDLAAIFVHRARYRGSISVRQASLPKIQIWSEARH